MEKREELLKHLGFSDELIEAINKSEDYDDLSQVNSDTTDAGYLSIKVNDSNELIIDKTPKPQNLVISSVRH